MPGKKGSRGPTIYEVARHAGVSPATVSRVMNGIAVDPTLAERVRESAAALNFVPNQTAVNLSRQRTLTVGVVVPDLDNPAFHGMLHGIERAASGEGYRVLIASSSEDATREPELARQTRRGTDAVILCAPRMPLEILTATLDDLDPVIIINRYEQEITVPVVAADYRRGIGRLAEHLLNVGHRRLLFLQGNPLSASNEQRRQGLDDLARRHPEVEVSFAACGVGFDDGYSAAAEVLASGATAVLAFNDLVAMGLLSALAERGVSVPDDISVTGFDNIPFSRFTAPPLTTVDVPAAELGAMAWDRAWELISGTESRAAFTLVPAQVIVRGSAAQVDPP